MIVPMQKTSVVVISSRTKDELETLAQWGKFHYLRSPTLPLNTETISAKIVHINAMLLLLPKSQAVSYVEIEEAEVVLSHLQSYQEEIEQLEEALHAIDEQITQLQPWGEYDPDIILSLQQSGYRFLLYKLQKEAYEQLNFRYRWIIKKGKILRVCVIAHESELLSEGIHPMTLPSQSLSQLREKKAKLQKNLKSIRKLLTNMKKEAAILRAFLMVIEEQMQLRHMQEGMESDEELTWFTGFIPEPQVSDFLALARRNGWGFFLREVSREDMPPTLLKKSFFAQLVNPIFDMFGTIPGYWEYDIRLSFLCFFTLFFSMIVSDAGYSAIFLFISLILLGKNLFAGRKVASISLLFFVLSFFALLWGGITGNWFGVEKIARIPLLKGFVFSPLFVQNPSSNELLMLLSLSIGMIHIFLAHLWKFLRYLRKGPRLAALGEVGWNILLIALFFLTRFVVISAQKYPIPPITPLLIASGVGLILLFGFQEGRFFKGIFRGVGSVHTIFLDGIGMFSDIISYIRLYAVGLAGLAVARSFNEMALTAEGTLVAGIASIFILILGHGLNIGMTMLSVVVHGVRLNMLEFSRHLGMEWNGVVYRPLKKAAVNYQTKITDIAVVKGVSV